MLPTTSVCLTGVLLAPLSFRSLQLCTNSLCWLRMNMLTSGGLPESPVKWHVAKEEPTLTQIIITKQDIL